MPDNIIEMKDVEKYYYKGGARITALNVPRVSFGPEKFVSICGHSGAGKTTLLALLGALDRPDKGSIIIDGVDIASLGEKERSALRAEKLGFVFQSANLIPTLTLEENVLLPLLSPSSGGGKETEISFARELLGRAGLEKRAKHLPAELSGGERQRAAIIRALVCRPQIIFADEPTANLDDENASIVTGLLFEALPVLRLLVVVSNDKRIPFPPGSRIITLANGTFVNP
jgi:putative ABC transport system ATP-binding protein